MSKQGKKKAIQEIADNNEEQVVMNEEAEVAVAGQTEAREEGGATPAEQTEQADISGKDVVEASGVATETGDIEALNQEIENLKQKVVENFEMAMRAQADLENLRKRTVRDIENAHKYALDKFINALLPVIDSMELGIDASASVDDIASLREGMDLTLKKFQDTLEKFGISTINPQGEKFDPGKHEAVSVQEIEGTESGIVITVMQKGYELNGRLVRPAMVVVAR